MLSRRYSSPEVMGIIGRCDLLLAGRLGSAVFATVTGTPLVAISYEDRTLDYMKRIGFEEHAFDWKTLHYEDMIRVIDNVLASRHDLKQKMQAQAKTLKTLAWQNAEFLYQHLHRTGIEPRHGEALTPP
jgi:polysaccharide pyruvyl transferase WcaK-like protein